MKKIVLIISALFFLCIWKCTNAQETITFNVGQQPVWGPIGHDYVDYYFLPDIDAYYNVPTHQFTWLEDNKWVSMNALPPRYASFDLFAAHKVVINQSDEPWLRDNENKSKYARFIGVHDQSSIRDSRGEKDRVDPARMRNSELQKQTK